MLSSYEYDEPMDDSPPLEETVKTEIGISKRRNKRKPTIEEKWFNEEWKGKQEKGGKKRKRSH